MANFRRKRRIIRVRTRITSSAWLAEKSGENKSDGTERASEWEREADARQKMAIARKSKSSSNGCARITNNSRKDVMTDEREKKLAKLLYLLENIRNCCHCSAIIVIYQLPSGCVCTARPVWVICRRYARLRSACERASTINDIIHSLHAKLNGKWAKEHKTHEMASYQISSKYAIHCTHTHNVRSQEHHIHRSQ